MDESTQSLALEVNANAFATTEASAYRAPVSSPTPSPPGLYFNYDIFAERAEQTNTLSGLLELGAFNALGVGTTTIALQNGVATRRAVRLDTTWTTDQPADVASLRLGDNVTAAAALWGRAVRFGGIQYATNFGTQPGFVTVPTQTFAGQAALPSTVDVYVNNILATRKDVPPGPFSINALPVVTGDGTVQLVIKDVLGREQVVSQPFYTSNSLLRPGLQDYSLELGGIRQNYGLTSFDYGPTFASATYRRGITDALTGEGHFEGQGSNRATLGIGAAYLTPLLGVVSTSIALSRSNMGVGRLWALGLVRRSEHLSFSFQTQSADERFQQLGGDANFPAPRRQTSANLGFMLNRYGSLNLTYLSQVISGTPRFAVGGVSYTLQIKHVGLVSISAFRALSGSASNSINVSLVLPLGGSGPSVSLTHTSSQGARPQSMLQVQRNLPVGDGYGYDLQAADNAPQQASLYLQNRVGTYTLEGAEFAGQSAMRVGVSGGGTVMDGSTFLSRHIEGSFGLVQLPNLPNVRVYADNQLVGRTDADGNALIPRLRPYEDNPIRIEERDLPWDTVIDSLSANAVPYYRSGIVIRPPARQSYGAMMRIVTPDGKPLSPGTQVRIAGQNESFPVALEGALFLTGLNSANRLYAEWDKHSCQATLNVTKSTDALPHLGDVICVETQP
ncbi:fimbria/pilus outer membrane usher protein [Paraburkholderia elongata]|uniref:fimbria/pilus outer membrane usher protein n=1 Tax=Paraburkholderia elongata TaxID=2675747 RepID=UPI0015538141|nr:fimbria/pilus outer membrane usher protein [Paraburkholderia elongata]